ncbi:unnamed protein product [Candidula unifasciata]|uniref:Uncharacterized protein n=1 Tax=Candidula unifasciata TaxID=100452 RepID=A0A8S3ZXF2_9EUPU|nr:unnamed protein product [Candidula unifasciata]
MDIARSWNFLEQILTDTSPSQVQWTVVQPCQELKEAVLFLGAPGMYELLEEWLHEILLQYLCRQVSPAFWKHFDAINSGSEDSEARAEAFSAAFVFLYGMRSFIFSKGFF